MLSSTAELNDPVVPLSTTFHPPEKEMVNSFYKDLLRDTAQNISKDSRISSTAQGGKRQEDSVSLSEEDLTLLTGQWRSFAVTDQIEKIRDCSKSVIGKAIAARLDFLRQCIREEEGHEADISLDSLKAMHSFVEQIPNVHLPEISLTSEGEVYIRWKTESGQLFSIHFFDDKRVRFVIFYSNPRHSGIVNRHSGYETIDTVLTSADRICSVRDWISG